MNVGPLIVRFAKLSVSALVTELGPGGFRGTGRLWVRMGIHLAVESILAGATRARMFVDDTAAPRAAMMWAGHRLYLAGEIGGDFDAAEGFAERHRQLVAYPSPEALDGAEGLLSRFGARRKVRLYYERDPSAGAQTVEPPEGYKVERITAPLLARGLGHADDVRAEMCSERESVRDFLAGGFGFAAVWGGEFACWCTSEYNLGDRCEVGIETARGHRRRGLATSVASALLGHAAKEGIRRVGWHCWADNEASVATAERLGFRRVAEYIALAVG